MAADDAVLTRKDGSKIQINDRVSSDDNYGTVKFIGSVPPTKGIWLGVDWDDPVRGKHDGCHEGKKYFETRYPTSGSFVRPPKVNLGVDCQVAIQERYGVQQNGDAGVDTEELFVIGADNKPTVVEMVGAEKINKKQSQLDCLKEVSIRGVGVYGVASDHGLKEMTPNIRELDLSLSLLASWDAVSKICRQLPKLCNLHVSENRLSAPTDPQKLASSFCNVTVLYLNKMDLTWEQVLGCCCMFPCLQKLYLCSNNVQSLCDPGKCLQNLTMITLESNHISSWEDILHLGKLKKLEVLVTSGNVIEKMYFPDASHGQKSQLFPSLRVLFFTGKHLKEASTFDELNKLANLEEVQFGEAGIQREIVISKMAKLKRCNRTVVDEHERYGSEIDYLKRFGKDWLKSGGNEEPSKNNPSSEFLTLHPRFQELVKKWGAPEVSEMKQQSKSLKDGLLALKIFTPQAPDKGVIEKKLPGTMTIQKVRTLVQRLYKIQEDFTLSYISHKLKTTKKEIEYEFDNELRQLSFYSVESGDTIIVKWEAV